MASAPLPPLHFLHALEAASRLGSFRAAAAELHVTPSAVSQQVRDVESALGARIFLRSGRSVALTPEGQIYCRAVRQALEDLGEAGRRLRAREDPKIVRVSTVDFLAHEFLIPRLPAFQARFPGTELRLETTMRVVALQGSEVDAALRVRGKAGAGLASEAIGPVAATPVCSPELARGIQSPADLSRQTLIEMRGGAEGSWTVAMQRLGVTEAPQLLALESSRRSPPQSAASVSRSGCSR